MFDGLWWWWLCLMVMMKFDCDDGVWWWWWCLMMMMVFDGDDGVWWWYWGLMVMMGFDGACVLGPQFQRPGGGPWGWKPGEASRRWNRPTVRPGHQHALMTSSQRLWKKVNRHIPHYSLLPKASTQLTDVRTAESLTSSRKGLKTHWFRGHLDSAY